MRGARAVVAMGVVSGALVACRALIGLDDVTLAGPGGGDPEAGVDGGPPALPRRVGEVCSRDGFCWASPLPQGNVLYAVWGASENDLFAVGEYGTIMHFDGKAWTGLAHDPRDVYVAITSDAKGRVWVAGSRAGRPLLLEATNPEYDSPFREVAIDDGPDTGAATSATALWFDGESTLFVARDDGAILKIAGGAAFTQATKATQPIHALWGERGSDLWAVGAEQLIVRYHYADDTWRPVEPPANGDWSGVVGADNVVYVVGGASIVEISGGGPAVGAFTVKPANTLALRAVFTGADGRPIAVGSENGESCVYERDPTLKTWTRSYGSSLGLDVGDGLVGGGRAGATAWAVGLGGAMARRADAKWVPAFQRNKLDPKVPDEAVKAVLPASPTEVWVVGEKTLSRFGGVKPSLEAVTGPITHAALAGEELWATTSEGVSARKVDGGWAPVPDVSVSAPNAIAARSATEALVLGTVAVRSNPTTKTYTTAGHFSAAKWVNVDLGLVTTWVGRGVWAAESGQYYVALSSCGATPCDGRAVQLAVIDSENELTDRTGDLSDRDGGPTVSGELITIWGMAGETYFGGVFDEVKDDGIPAGNLIVRNAVSAARVLLPKGANAADSPVTLIHGAGGDLWAGGAPRTVWHRNGSNWEALASGYYGGPVTGLFVRAPGEIWIAGSTGAVLRRRP